MGSFEGRGNQYIQYDKGLYCKLLSIGKQLPTFTHKVPGFKPLTSEVGVSVLPLHNYLPNTIGSRVVFYKIL